MTDTTAPLGEWDKARWARVDELLDAALDLDKRERGAFLQRECGDDVPLRTEVEQLLAACEKAGGFLESPARELGAAMLAEPEGELHFGPYKTIGVAGRGGMGVVYLAERDDNHFQMRVAIKVLPRGMENTQSVRRFLEERQILARLQHPSIARLLDGGLAADGRPYFAMEYVEGTPLDKYCNDHNASIAERLALFCRVCEAVEYAHANLVVHRDIKPGNILITATGDVKLLDFGIARLTEPGLVERELTGTGRRWMTPEYASPEQVRGDPVTTQSDVYALGVVLYKLLAGRSPYDPTGRTSHDVEREILDVEPPRPSDTVKALRGDLDAIVLRAIRKEPATRYPSAEALRQDIVRYLDGRAVEARQGTRRYRAARFIRRHRVGAAASLLLLLSLMGGLGGTMWQARAAAHETARAERVQAFLVDIFDRADPERVNGDSITARQLLDEGAKRIDVQLRDEPETQARMYMVLGGIYRRLTVPGPADSMFARALALQLRMHGRYDLATTDVLEQQALVAVEQQKLPTAEQLMREVLVIRGHHVSANDTLMAQGLAGLANVLYAAGRWDEADRTIRSALEIDAKAKGSSLRTAADLEQLSAIFRKRGKPDSALAIGRRALEIRERDGGVSRLTTKTAMMNLGRVYQSHGDFAVAESLFRQAIAFDKQRLGAESRSTLTDISDLASAVSQQGRLPEAETLEREMIDASARAYPSNHPFPYIARNNLAHTLAAEGKFAEAETLYQQSYEGLRRTLGPDHPDAIGVEASLATMLAIVGKTNEADTVFSDAVARIRRAVGDDNPRSAAAMQGYSEFLLKRHQAARALPLMRSVARVVARALAPDHPERLRAESVLGACLSETGNVREGGALLEQSYASLLRLRGSADVYTERARSRLTSHYISIGRRDLADSLTSAVAKRS